MITLHHCPQTRSMRTLWLLHELEVPFQLQSYPFDRTLRSAAFLNLSPAGRVPALEIDGECMFETGAITEYLCERFSPDDLGRTPGTPERMTWLIWLHFSETLSQHTAALTQQHVALYEDHMRSPIVMKLEAARVRKCYTAIEARLSTPIEKRDYLLTSGFTAADISVGQAVYMARHFAKLDDFPATATWYARITAREGFKASLPADDGIYAQDFYAPWPVD
ncbi:glutathione S-transferase family protein [Roseobacter sp.]|uniref:glutathione S-transferase family protein n=1 Tax=Roseobacter sp. TaxID=1907202 RepID=UPI002967262D|nr:glutathione S-transferase family protein [Roseobacter sp.]MDW3184494.1 glutathione S-transferase family protein [Roseobacter sp.]